MKKRLNLMAQSLLVLVVLFCRRSLFLRSSIFDLQTRIENYVLVLLNERFVQISDDVI